MTKRLDYSQYDFDAVVAQLQEKLSALGTWKDAYRSSTGQTLIELFAYVADLLNYMVERKAEELNVDFAQLRSSVVALAALTGYSPRRKVSAVSTLKFTLSSSYWTDQPAANTVFVNRHTSLVTSGGVKFLTSPTDVEETRIEKPDLELEVEGVQGEEKTYEFTQTDPPVYEFTIPSAGDDIEAVENGSIKFYVDDVEWTKVDSFVDQTADAKVYTVSRKSTSLILRVGDNLNGLTPVVGSSIKIEWIETLGGEGNVYGSDIITTIETALEDDNGHSLSLGTEINVTNTDAGLGGEDEEDIEEIRVNFPRVFATGDRAVTRGDYKALLLAYPGVLKAECFGEQEQLGGESSNPDYAWKVVLVIVPSGFEDISPAEFQALKDAILIYLESKKVLGTSLSFEDPTYIYVDFEVHAYAVATYDASEVEAGIVSALDGIVNLQDISLGDDVRYSDVVRAIDEVDGVSYHHTEVYAAEEIGEGDDITTQWSATLKLTPLDRGNVLVYLDNNGELTRVGYDDGEGTLQSDPSLPDPRVTGGTVDYSSGVITDLTFSSPPSTGVKVRIRYQTGDYAERVIGIGDGYTGSFNSVLMRTVSRGTVEVYRGETLVASDDGAGVLVDAGSGELDEGTVNYTSGDVYVKFSAGLEPASGEQVVVHYYRETMDLEAGLTNLLLMGYKSIVTESV